MLKTWFETAPQLIDVAMGRSPADMVIRKGRWVNVHSGEIIPDTDIAIIAGRFAYVGLDASHAIGGDHLEHVCFAGQHRLQRSDRSETQQPDDTIEQRTSLVIRRVRDHFED